MKRDEQRGMFCIDWTDDLEIYGEEQNPEFQKLEFLFLPCNYIHQIDGYTGDYVKEECIADLEKQKEYLGPLDMLIYFNDEEFDQQAFGNEAISRQSQLINVQFSQN